MIKDFRQLTILKYLNTEQNKNLGQKTICESKKIRNKLIILQGAKGAIMIEFNI